MIIDFFDSHFFCPTLYIKYIEVNEVYFVKNMVYLCSHNRSHMWVKKDGKMSDRSMCKEIDRQCFGLLAVIGISQKPS